VSWMAGPRDSKNGSREPSKSAVEPVWQTNENQSHHKALLSTEFAKV
jgi:hypothetical protein